MKLPHSQHPNQLQQDQPQRNTNTLGHAQPSLGEAKPTADQTPLMNENEAKLAGESSRKAL